MANNEQKALFCDHFRQDKPTMFGSWLVRSMSKRIFEFAKIQQGCSVLEIGPGRGVFADICISNGIEYWAIEANDKMAQALEKRGVNVLRNLVPPVPTIERTFDVVVMINVIEHMDTMTAALQVATQAYKLLNPQGRFVIYSPDYINWKHHFFLNDFSHNYVTTWKRLQSLLTSAGFEETDAKYQSGHFQGATSLLLSVIASRLPFGWLTTMFPKNKLLFRFYKLQTTFLRRVLIAGIKKPHHNSA